MMPGSDYSRIAKSIHLIEARLEDQPNLAELAASVGLSAFHFQRLFRKWVGITPKDFMQVLSLGRAKQMLTASSSILETSCNLGYSSPARLHDLFVTHEAMTPGQYKAKGAGLTVHWGLWPTALGPAFVAVTSRGVCGLEFIEEASLPATLAAFQARWPEAELMEKPEAIAPLGAELNRRLAGQGQEALTLILKGTKFQVKVWEALLNIPEGQALSYRELAQRLGMPKACRAVGSAIGANAIAYLIPCHRVIHASGALGKYRWGHEKKAALLALERASDAERAPDGN